MKIITVKQLTMGGEGGGEDGEGVPHNFERLIIGVNYELWEAKE